VKAVTALDDGNAELLFELADAAGERRLRDVAGLCRAGEVLFARKRDKILELPNIHGESMVLTPNSQPPTTKESGSVRAT